MQKSQGTSFGTLRNNFKRDTVPKTKESRISSGNNKEELNHGKEKEDV